MLKAGDKAPELLGLDENGKEIRMADFQGKKLVLYFYPKDSTSGCTAEACSLRDNYSALRKLGYAVVGVSVQDAKSHQKFIEKNQLPFPLIADTENRLVQEFGAWGRSRCTAANIWASSAPPLLLMRKVLSKRCSCPRKSRPSLTQSRFSNS